MCGCDPSINGISVRQNEIKLSQYSDDHKIILDGSKDTLETSFDLKAKKKKEKNWSAMQRSKGENPGVQKDTRSLDLNRPWTNYEFEFQRKSRKSSERTGRIKD